MPGREKLLIDDLGVLHLLDLDTFPTATSFEIELTVVGDSSSIRFADPVLHVAVEFPWWEDVKSDIAQWSLADIPNGSIESPYWDMDQGWHIVIWQSGDQVYIAQGGNREGEYDSWFAVPVSLYRAEWKKAIHLAVSAD